MKRAGNDWLAGGASSDDESVVEATASRRGGDGAQEWVMMMTAKDYGRPSTFDGSEELWAEWSFAVRAYLVVTELCSPALLDRICKTPYEITWDLVEDESKKKCQTMYYALAMLCRGRASTLLRSGPMGNGYEAWRRLSLRFDRADHTTVMSMLQTVLGFKCTGTLAGSAECLRRARSEV